MAQNKRVTLRDVARLAQVHPGTASRALNEQARAKKLVNPETAARVLQVAQELNYNPDPAARSLKTRRSHTVGVLIPDLTNPLFPPIIRGIEDRLAQSGFVVLLGNTDDDPKREKGVLEGMLSRRVDGLVLATAMRRSDIATVIGSEDLPIVLINRVVDDHAFPSVATDDVAGIKMAVAHLASLGHTRIAHLAGPQALSTGANRYRGFLAGMEAAGIPVDPELVVFAESFSHAEGVVRCRELLASRHGCTAIVAANDMLAIGCYQALEESGLTCPEDVSVVGFNDAPFSNRLSPPLSSVSFPHYQVGIEAAQLVLERISDPTAPTKVLFLPPELVVRRSTTRVASAVAKLGGRTTDDTPVRSIS